MSKEITTYSMAPQNFEQAMTFSQMLADSDMVPKDFKGKPGNCLIAMQWGHEVGMQALQAIQNIAVINGRPAMWGDAVIALVRSSPLCEYIKETDDGTTATCAVKRKGQPEEIRTFSVEDAKTAGLFGKAGPWTTNPKRMRQMRARAFGLRDVFADVLRGMAIVEEVMDYSEKDMGTVQRVEEESTPEKVVEFYPKEDFYANFPKWEMVIAAGRKTALDVISTVELKAPLTESQKKKIEGVKVVDQADQQAPADAQGGES